MAAWNPENERVEAEAYLKTRRSDFTTTYMQVANLQYIIAQQPEIVGPGTVAALCAVLEGAEHRSQRQVFFLFKKAADALAAIVSNAAARHTAEQARQALAQILAEHTGPSFRASAEAIGALPLTIKGPDNAYFQIEDPPVAPLRSIDSFTGMRGPGRMQWIGRSLVIELPAEPGRLLVLKFARHGQPLSTLAAETRWMTYLSGLAGQRLSDKDQLDIPEPVSRRASSVFRIEAPGLNIPPSVAIDPGRHAIAFKAGRQYFQYPNHPANGKMPGKADCRNILGKNARLLGQLASLGIVHTAPIPLFHNRVQRHRRQDRGVYEWRRGGRLDQWLASCRFPNFSSSGIRDFEHFIAFNGSARQLYAHIGAHIFSLILVAGSYFRNQDETRVGLDAGGSPMDTRDLFDPEALTRVLAIVFDNYYRGFTGLVHSGPYPCDLAHLSRRLVEEMGVDRHMEELLRLAEQEQMSHDEFTDFLGRRGFSPALAAGFKKDQQDIRILTGPHLGGFNERISVPELIEYTAALSALCIMDRYCGQHSEGRRQAACR